MSFMGTYANLSGQRSRQRIGDFRVERLCGRDRKGAPVWSVVCGTCQHEQALPHAKLLPLVLASQPTLRCANSACPQSRHDSQIETITEFRRRERRQAEHAATAVAEAQREADAKAARDREQAVRDAEIQRQYLQYLNHQWAALQEDSKICTRTRWFELLPSTRKYVLDVLSVNPDVRISGF
jgi:hypothetical protein